jgi:glyoxylase-like metal-dependent hydrolase (beta-lactamase superfamily II)
MAQLPAIERFDSDSGAKIYRIPMIVFPNGFMAYSFLVLDAGPPTLIDTGSGIADSNDHLLQGLQAIHDDFGEAIQITDIAHILITHGHMDHFGGLAFMAEQTGAKVGVHELDRRVLTNYEERVAIATKDLRIYLERAGIEEAARQELIDMYGFAKKHIRSVDVDFSLEEDVVFEGMQFVHAPGHCPGQVCIILGNVMLTADHILSLTTPHQAPESITHYTGLGHYKDSLRKIAKIDGIELAIGSHEEAMHDIYGRIEAIQASHDRKLNRVFDIIQESPAPSTIYEITLKMYPDKVGYESLLALEEAGAHIEYLYQHGKISVANLDEVETEDNPALRYTAL